MDVKQEKTTLTTRLPEGDKETLRVAAAVSGKSLSAFVVDAAMAAANPLVRAYRMPVPEVTHPATG